MSIKKIVLTLIISNLFALLIGLILIPFLKKFKINQSLSIYLSVKHKEKKNTPTMGGIIFVLSTILTMFILFLLGHIKITYNFLIVIFVFISYFLIGFIDDYLIIKRKNNDGLTEKAKLILQIIIAIIFFNLFLKTNESLLWIHTLNLKLNIDWYYGLLILFILIASSNAVNLTDGLDGLAGGLSVFSFLTLGIVSLFTGWLDGYFEISLFCFSLVGSLLGFLAFNLNPAKVFMGDTGSLTLGAVMGTISVLTRHEILLVLIGFVYVIETLSCLIQRYYFKLTKKRLFPMAPLHHTFEKLGFSEVNIVKIFWIVGLIFDLIALLIGIYV